ncbi:MAG: hypothetical protein QF662_07275 [Phycisphaerae bacterium]|jgi:hypothetical protein|nr:hypothetical protein [Phycisphaerae bacterium]
MSRYPLFDRSKLEVLPLDQREHDMTLDDVLALDAEVPPFDSPALGTVVERIVEARKKDLPVVLMMGAHVIKQGCSRFIVRLMEAGLVTHVGFNGACSIHDFELALIGATTESVARYIRTGQFGLWNETGRINDIVREGAGRGLGIGEALGVVIEGENFPHRDLSILAAGHRLGIPVTVHIGVGYDIINEHPNFDGAAFGQASYTDFLVFARTVEQLEGGVFLNFGTAVMGPEVYLKCLAMARNVARQEGRQICHFTTAVFDLTALPKDYHEEAGKTHAGYYFRPWKTVLIRTVADGGESLYIRGDHRVTMPTLVNRLLAQTEAD